MQGQRARALCLLQEAEYGAAADALARLEAVEPALAGDLGIARFHARDRVGAEDALRRAEARGDGRAEIAFYLGLVALDRARAAEAAERFERAGAAAPDALAPAATYYAGLSRARAGDREAARVAFARVAREWPDTPWAAQAEREAEALAEPRERFAALRLGFEHDSNAVLRGEGVVLPDEIPSEADQRFVWRAIAGRTWQLSGKTQAGGALSFGGSAHGDLARFDVLQPSGTLWADWRLGERTTLRGIAAYSHAWVGNEQFLSAPSFAAELHHDWGERGVTRFSSELALDDYRFESGDAPGTPERRARDRDGLGVRIAAEHQLSLAAFESSLWATLAYRRFSADGTEYSFDAPELELAWQSALPAEVVLGAGVRYAYRHYRHPTSYPPAGSERNEHDWRTEVSLRRPIWRQLSLETRWRYQRNRSSVAVFDYTRHVAGLYMSWTPEP